MSEKTPLDLAHDLMAEGDAARLEFYELLVQSELFLLLEAEPLAEVISPRVFEIDGAKYVFAFDRADRLAEFAGGVVPFAALVGRDVVAMLAGQDLGLGVNPGVAPSSILIPVDGVAWLVDMLAQEAAELAGQIVSLGAAAGLDVGFQTGLADRLAGVAGMAGAAYLVGVEYGDGTRGNLLGFVDALEPAKAALRQIVAEFVAFRGGENALDVGFFAGGDALVAAMVRAGVALDMKLSPEAVAQTSLGPGMDPDKPPNLR